MITPSTALFALALILAVIAIIPRARDFFLLHAAVVLLAIGLVLESGLVKGS